MSHLANRLVLAATALALATVPPAAAQEALAVAALPDRPSYAGFEPGQQLGSFLGAARRAGLTVRCDVVETRSAGEIGRCSTPFGFDGARGRRELGALYDLSTGEITFVWLREPAAGNQWMAALQRQWGAPSAREGNRSVWRWERWDVVASVVRDRSGGRMNELVLAGPSVPARLDLTEIGLANGR